MKYVPEKYLHPKVDPNEDNNFANSLKMLNEIAVCTKDWSEEEKRKAYGPLGDITCHCSKCTPR